MDTTVITLPDTNWNYLPTLVIARRLAAGQIPLTETTASRIIYHAPLANVGKIFRIGDPLSGGLGEQLLSEESWEDDGLGHERAASMRIWYIKGTAGDKLEISLIN